MLQQSTAELVMSAKGPGAVAMQSEGVRGHVPGLWARV